MGILDGIVEWVSEQVMNALDLITTSVLGTLGCDMNTVFLLPQPLGWSFLTGSGSYLRTLG